MRIIHLSSEYGTFRILELDRLMISFLLCFNCRTLLWITSHLGELRYDNSHQVVEDINAQDARVKGECLLRSWREIYFRYIPLADEDR